MKIGDEFALVFEVLMTERGAFVGDRPDRSSLQCAIAQDLRGVFPWGCHICRSGRVAVRL